jgi:hypothetical protein
MVLKHKDQGVTHKPSPVKQVCVIPYVLFQPSK